MTSSHRSGGTSTEAGEQSSASDSSAASAVQRAVSMRVLRPRQIRTSKAGKTFSVYTSLDYHIRLNGTAELRWGRIKRGWARAPSGAATAGVPKRPNGGQSLHTSWFRCLSATLRTSSDPVAATTARRQHVGCVQSPDSMPSRPRAACAEANLTPLVICGNVVCESM